jgi:hypothetical protein
MAKCPTPGPIRSRLPEDTEEAPFLDQVYRLPAAHRTILLAWLRRWRRRPGRVFWVMDAAGRWNIVC